LQHKEQLPHSRCTRSFIVAPSKAPKARDGGHRKPGCAARRIAAGYAHGPAYRKTRIFYTPRSPPASPDAPYSQNRIKPQFEHAAARYLRSRKLATIFREILNGNLSDNNAQSLTKTRSVLN
jgi:hypothetical protein